MFVINPDPYSLPCYRIGPFQTKDLSTNHCLPDSIEIDSYLHERFGDRNFIFTLNGRRAIYLALAHYDLEPDDVVTILTTSGNFYISGCVTKEIEKFCKWSRNVEKKTKILLVNHEFGYPYEKLIELRKLKLPIIEDCAGTFFSQDVENNVGQIGDFVIYSFPKMFPLQIGGLLVSNLSGVLEHNNPLEASTLRHIKNVLSSQITYKDEIIDKRKQNYKYLRDKFANFGCEERFKLNDGTVPAVFMFKTSGLECDLSSLKVYFYEHGIQCSVFYGEEAFFIPVHQALTVQDLDYFHEVFYSFINQAQ